MDGLLFDSRKLSFIEDKIYLVLKQQPIVKATTKSMVYSGV